MKRKIFSIDIAVMGDIANQAIANGKVIEMKYADGEAIESGVNPQSMELDIQNSRLLITMDCQTFEDVAVPSIVEVKGVLLEKKGIVIE